MWVFMGEFLVAVLRSCSATSHGTHVRFTRFKITLVASAVLTVPCVVHSAAAFFDGSRSTNARMAFVASAVEIDLLPSLSPQHDVVPDEQVPVLGSEHIASW